MSLSFSSLSRVFGIMLVLMLSVGVVSQAADKKKKTKGADAKAKASGFEDADKNAAADDDEMKADDKAATKTDPKSTKTDPKSDANKEDAADDDENGFGAGRQKSSKAGKKLDEAELSTDKDKARYVKMLRRQFEEEQGYYVVQAVEQGMEEDKDGSGSGDAQSGGAALAGYKPYEKSELHVFAGRDEAVSFLVDYMTEHGKPWEKKPKKEKGSRGKKDKQVAVDAATGEPPKPVRDFKILDCYASAEEADMAMKAQQEHLNQATGKYDDNGVKRGRGKKQYDE